MSYDKHGTNLLKGVRKYRVGPKVEPLVIKKFLSSLDCPRALTVWILYESGEHAQLASLGFNPEDYDGVIAIRDAYAATKFLSKFSGLSLGYDLDDVALTKFKKFEELCRHTNQRFRDLSVDPLFRGSTVHIHNACVRKIEKILGNWSADEFFECPDWGPGATTLIRRRDASSEVKFQCETGITRDLHALLPIETLSSAFPHWGDVLMSGKFPTFQVGNKVVTVPKDARSNRVIAIEPGINLFFQKSIGEMIRKRLLVTKTDIRDQGRNQRAAKSGSLLLDTATLDLSSASDSISLNLVEELLPPRWFSLLDSCRSKYGSLKGEQMRWEKFSSMGNGFTFPLQTLIFYALAFACVEYHDADLNKICVYGDDIIIPSVAFETFSAMLDFYGFQLNRDKSFVNSMFRESCGSHYFAGVDVKPFYLKDRILNILSIFKTANAIRRISHSRCSFGCDSSFYGVHHYLVSVVPLALRFWISEGYGDGGFISNFDEARPKRARFQIEGFEVRTLVQSSRKRVEERPGYLLAELWRIDGRDGLNMSDSRLPPRLLAIRDEMHGLDGRPARKNRLAISDTYISITESLVPRWVDLGPWI